MSMKSIPVWAMAALCLAATVEAQKAPLIPMKDFFRNPEKVYFQLSPDGAHLAFLQPWESRLNVHVQKMGDEKVTRITEFTARDVQGYNWKGNDRIVYVVDKGGDENFRLYSVGIDGSNPKDLTPYDKVRVEIIDILEDNPTEMLISMNKRNPQLFDVYRINVDTGDMNMIAENPGNISGWQTDNAGQLRVATTSDGVNTSLLYRKTEADSFRTVVTTSFKEQIAPLYFTFDDAMLYVSSNIDRDKAAIYKYDVENGKMLDLIYENPEVDVERILRSKLRKVVTGVAYVTDKTHYQFFDDQRRTLQERLEQLIPGVEVGVAGMSKDETKVLAVGYSDRSQGSYYFYDRAADKLTKLVDISPWINEADMAPMKPIQYTSRDGLTIHGYLTCPSASSRRTCRSS